MPSVSSSCFVVNARGIHYAEPRSRLVFAGLACASLVSLAATNAMLASATWSPWKVGLWPTLAALAFAAFAAIMAVLAVAALQPQQLHFDAETRRVYGRMRGRLWLTRQVSADFDALQQPTVREHERESQGPLYELHLEVIGKPALALGGFDERADAEHWRARLECLMRG